MKNVEKTHIENLFVVPEGEGLAGIVFLNSRIPNPTVPVDDFLAVLKANGLKEHAPKKPSRRDSLTRAVAPVRNRHRSADRLTGDVVGYQVTDKTPQGDKAIGYEPQFTVYIDPQDNQIKTTKECELADEVIARYREHFNFFTNDAIKRWEKEQIYRLGGVKIVDNGHGYYVPACSMDELRKIKTVVEDVSDHRLRALNVGNDVDTVEAVVAGLEAEIEQAAKVADSVLNPPEDKTKPGRRALRTQVDVLDTLKAKLQKYEKIFNKSLDHIAENMDELRANIVLAVVALERDADLAAGREDVYDAALAYTPAPAPVETFAVPDPVPQQEIAEDEVTEEFVLVLTDGEEPEGAESTEEEASIEMYESPIFEL